MAETLLSRIFPLQQSISPLPTAPYGIDGLGAWISDAIDGDGERIGPVKALGISTFFACVRNISEDLAKLPIEIYSRGDGGIDKIIHDNPIEYAINDEPNPNMHGFSFKETILQHALAWHGGFAEIVWSPDRSTVQLWLMDPASVIVHQDRKTLDLIYEHRNADGTRTFLPQESVFHIRGIGYDGITSYIMASLGSQYLGSALALQKYRRNYFKNGAQLGGIVFIPKALKPEARQRLKDAFIKRHEGEDNAHKTLFIEEDGSYQQVSSNAHDSQAVDATRLNSEEVARAYRMPLSKIQLSTASPRANVEEENKAYRTDCLQSWERRFCAEVERKLLRPGWGRKLRCRFHWNMLALADIEKRNKAQSIGVQTGKYTINEVRAQDGMPPVKHGDGPLVPVNVQPLERAFAQPDPDDTPDSTGGPNPATGGPEPPPSAGPPSPDDDANHADLEQSRHALLLDMGCVMLAREIAKNQRVAISQASKAKKRGELAQWRVDYQDTNPNECREAFIPALAVICTATGADTERIPHICEQYQAEASKYINAVLSGNAKSDSLAIEQWSQLTAEKLRAEVEKCL